MKKRPLILILMAVLFAVLTGCASLAYTSNYNHYVERQVLAYTYPSQMASQLITAARSVLFEAGYRTYPPMGLNQFETDWYDTGSGYRRYMVTVYQTSTGSSIQFQYVESTYQQPGMRVSQTSARDYRMECEVMKRVSPSDWARISAEADAYANQIAASSK